MAKKEKLLVGVDIGSYAVKVCQLKKAGDGYSLISLGSAAIPPGSVEDGILLEPEPVGKVINELFKNLKLGKNTKVGMSISGYSVIVKKVNLDVMSPDELADYIETEAEQYVPFDIEDVYLDFQDLNTGTEENERTDVMLVAAKKEVVDTYVDMLRAQKIIPLLVDVDGFALENIWQVSEQNREDIALIDIGASKMNINIIVDGASMLARDIVAGSQQLTEQIANTLDLEFDEAEQIKLGIIPAGDHQKKLEEIVTSVCTNWVIEIQKAIDLYMSKNPDKPLKRLVLSGGGSKIAGLTQFISQETGIEVVRFNPFSSMKLNEKKIDRDYLNAIAPEMAIAAGLAIRQADF